MQTYWDSATGQWVTRGGGGATRPATAAEIAQAVAVGGGTGANPSPPGGMPYVPSPPSGPGTGGGIGGGPVPPGSTDPLGGGPTYTPGISFGAGIIPGQGTTQRTGAGGGATTTTPYQRSWFDVGPGSGTEGLNQAYYNDPGNWGYAWDKVLNQFGGQVGGDFYKFLQGFSNTARGDFQNSVPYNPNLNVADFLDQYAPQIAGVYKLQPSAQTHGSGAFGLAGRATY